MRPWAREGLDPRRLRGPGAAVARAARVDRPTSVKEIAERTNLPQPYLEQILLAVKGAGLVRSKRGVGGGYVLARPPPRSRSPTSSPRSTARSPPCSASTTTARATACCRRCGSACPRRWARSSSGFTLAELVERTRVGHPDVARPPAAIGARPSLAQTVASCAPASRSWRRGTRGVEPTPPRAHRCRGSSATPPPSRHDELGARSRPGRSPRAGGRLPAPLRQKRSKARARCSSVSPGPASATAHLDAVAATRRRRSHRSARAARPRARWRGGCRAPARDGPGTELHDSPSRHRPTRLTSRSAANAVHASHPPVDDGGDGTASGSRRRARRGPARGARRRGETGGRPRRAPRSTSSLGVVSARRASARGSRAAAAARRAASAAGATRRRRTTAGTLTSRSSCAAVRLNDSASARISGGPSGTGARASRSPAPSRRGPLSAASGLVT